MHGLASVHSIGDNRKGGARRAPPPFGVSREFRMAWLIVAMGAFFATFFGVAAWECAQRRDRSPTLSGKMWATAWVTAGLLSATLIMAAGNLVQGSLYPRPTPYVLLAVGAIIAAWICGCIHGHIAERVLRFGPDSHFEDLEDFAPPRESVRR